MSWEGHLSGGIMGTLCAFVFVNHGPQRPEPFADEMEEEEEHEETNENGDVISEWTITTTTRITQIYWERGMIEKTHPDTGVSGG